MRIRAAFCHGAEKKSARDVLVEHVETCEAILQEFQNRPETAIPAEVWQKARDSWCIIPGRILFGNYTGQISLRGMIESAASLS